jgi:hypothetical protein
VLHQSFFARSTFPGGKQSVLSGSTCGCAGQALTRLAIALCVLAACDEPELASDLKAAGPPEVELVAVVSESAAAEVATFCGDGKRNANYCPEEGAVAPVADAVPLAVTLRVAFDELLDPSIEVIDDQGIGSIAAAEPLAVVCDGRAVAYEGYYDPSGSHLTFPAGPALVVTVQEGVKSGAGCQVSVSEAVVDKDGRAVPDDQRGPYAFALADLRVVNSSPADGAEGVDPNVSIAVSFNNLIDEATLAGRITLTDSVGAVPFSAAVSAANPSQIEIVPASALAAGTSYTVSVLAAVADPYGGTLAADSTFGFSTAP